MLALPAVAQAEFSSQLVPLTTVLPGGNTGISDVAVNPGGDALIAWTEGGTSPVVVKARRVHPDGSMGQELTISDPTQRAGGARLAFAPNGDAIVAWSEAPSLGASQSVKARWIGSGDSLGPEITLRTGSTTSDSAELGVAVTSTGVAVVAWHNFKAPVGQFRELESVHVNESGGVGTLNDAISGPGATDTEVLPDTSGGALLAWRELPSLKARALASNDTLGTLQTPTMTASAGPVLTGDGHDHFRLIYRAGNNPYSLEYQTLAPNGTSSAPQTLDPGSADFLSQYDMATNSANRSLVAWNRSNGSVQVVKARFIDGAGSFGTDIFSVPDPAGNPQQSPTAAIGDGGEAALAWLSTPAMGNPSMWGRSFSAAGVPSAPVALSTDASHYVGTPFMRMAPNDVGIVAWYELVDPTNTTTYPTQLVFRQILPLPVCADVAGTIVEGRPTRISLSCTGLQLGAPSFLSQPAHGTLGTPDVASQSVVYTPKPGYAGPDSFSFSGVNPAGAGAGHSATLSVGKDTIRPVVRRFRISPRRIHLASAGAAARKRKPTQRRTTFRVSFSEPSTATITIARRHHCRPRARHCKRYRKFGTLRVSKAGTSGKASFRRRIGRHRLRTGRFRASLVATDLAGNRSRVKRLRFRVVR